MRRAGKHKAIEGTTRPLVKPPFVLLYIIVNADLVVIVGWMMRAGKHKAAPPLESTR
jgi:hypothetical protein